MKPTEPELPNFIVKKYTPKVQKSPTHINLEFTIAEAIELYDDLIIASVSYSPHSINFNSRARARRVKEEILGVDPSIY